jgi:hypothetical protein
MRGVHVRLLNIILRHDNEGREISSIYFVNLTIIKANAYSVGFEVLTAVTRALAFCDTALGLCLLPASSWFLLRFTFWHCTWRIYVFSYEMSVAVHQATWCCITEEITLQRYTNCCGNALLLINKTKDSLLTLFERMQNFCASDWRVDMLCIKWQLRKTNCIPIPSYFVRESVT